MMKEQQKLAVNINYQGGWGRPRYFSFANGVSDLKLYLPSQKTNNLFHCVLVSSYQHEMFAKENLR